jgi:hypothetical protein
MTFSSEMAQDLAEIFSMQMLAVPPWIYTVLPLEFAVAATLKHESNSILANILFYNPSDEAMASFLGTGFVSASPYALARTADALSIIQGDTVIIGSTTYYVRNAKPNGDGISLLELSLDA